jgi:hypothetical protein
MIYIQVPSVQSLYVEPRFNGQKLSNATGFVAMSPSGWVLITNRHVVTGRHQDTEQCLSKHASIPNELAIFHNKKGMIGQWVERVEPLLDENGNMLWHEHPSLGSRADFIAIKLTITDDADFVQCSLGINDPLLMIEVTDKVSVAGFPFGIRTSGGFAIWATGSIATEPEINHEELPIFLIDCRSRQGQSGSLVVAHRTGSETVWLENGNMIANGMPATRFLGIYSGRINKESDLGIVWKATILRELVESIR